MGVSEQNKKNYHRILYIQVNLDSKYQLQHSILIFGANFQKKKYTSGQKQKKMNITIESFIFELVYVPIFSLNWQLQFLDRICQKG